MKTFEILERTSARYSATIKDESSTVVPSADISEINLTIFNLDSASKDIINNRGAALSNYSIFNANGGTMNATSGELLIDLSEADNQIMDTNISHERHMVQLEIKYNIVSGSPTKTLRHAFKIVVDNLSKVS